MKTVLVMVLYAVVGTLGGWKVSFLANLAGGLGALVGSLGRWNDLAGVRKGLAVAFCALGQAYVFLGWVAFVVGYTTSVVRHQQVVRWLVWIAAFYVAMVPIIAASGDSTRDEKEQPDLKYSVPHLALNVSVLLDLVGFFVFIFFPTVMLYGWGWIPFVGTATQP